MMSNQNSGSFIGPSDDPDKYRLRRQVGHGGEAELWQADLHLVGGREPVAVKILNSEHGTAAAMWQRRWADQVDLLRLIHHPAVVGVHCHFEGAKMHAASRADPASRCLCLVMNWVDGPTLRDWVVDHHAPKHRTEAMRYLGQVAAVLDHLHSGRATPSGRAVIHGDISPSNVIINPDGQAVLVDFGLFRIARHVSMVGAGTEGYCAPEVSRAGEYSPASDRYAFGGLIDQLARIFSDDPAQRPPAGQWLRLLRMHSTAAVSSHGVAAQPGGSAHRQRRLTAPAAAAVLLTSVLLVVGAVAMISSRSGANQGGGALGPSATNTVTGPPETPKPSPSTAGATSATATSGGTTPPSSAGSDDQRADLGELSIVDGGDEGTWTSVTVDSKVYPNVLTAKSGCYFRIEYHLGKGYTRFHADVGIDDLAKTGATATFGVYADGAKATKTVQLFETKTIDVSLAGAQRMVIWFNLDNARSGYCSGYAGFIDPYVVPVASR
jgi:serine/threonine protein kinase